MDFRRRSDERYDDPRRRDAGVGPVEGTGSEVWGYEDDEDVMFTPDGAGAGGILEIDEVLTDVAKDDGSGGSRAGPVDREHFYSIKVTFYCFSLFFILRTRTVVC